MKNTEDRILGIDYGYARMGVALSDVTKTLASPLENLQGSKNPEKAATTVVLFIEKLQKERYAISEVVIGLPLRLDGSSSETTLAAKAFASTLQEKIPIPVVLFDERLTSVQAERMLSTAFSRKKRKPLVDRVAAVLLLQTFLNQRKNNESLF